MRIGSGFRIVFSVHSRRFNGDLDNDLPHRPALARGDARRVRVLRKEDRKPPAAERQLCRFALIEPYVALRRSLGHPLHRGERRNADQLLALDEVLDVDILPVRLGPVVFRLCFIALEEREHPLAVDLHTSGLHRFQLRAGEIIERLCEISAQSAVLPRVLQRIVYHGNTPFVFCIIVHKISRATARRKHRRRSLRHTEQACGFLDIVHRNAYFPMLFL